MLSEERAGGLGTGWMERMLDLDSCCEVTPLGDLLVRAARRCPERAALVFPEFSRTYADLLTEAVRIARGLLAAGVRPREHVGILAVNSPELVEAFFGTVLAGCVAVPLQARHRSSELGYIIKDADLVALLTMSDPGARVDLSEIVESALPSLRVAADPANLALAEA